MVGGRTVHIARVSEALFTLFATEKPWDEFPSRRRLKTSVSALKKKKKETTSIQAFESWALYTIQLDRDDESKHSITHNF